MAADPLTKVFSKANMTQLIQIMRAGIFNIIVGDTVIGHRRRIKESGQTLPRLKGITLRESGGEKGIDGNTGSDAMYHHDHVGEDEPR